MNDFSDTRRLADAITVFAATMTEILEEKMRAIADGNDHAAEGIVVETPLKAVEPMMTANQLARHLCVSRRTLENWMRKGYVPYLKLGRNVRFNLADVEDHLRRCHRVCRRRV